MSEGDEQLGEPRASRGTMILTLAVALAVALIAAGLVAAWARGPIPTFLVLTPIFHGMLVGVALKWRFGRAPLPRRLALVVSVCAALASAWVLSATHYVLEVEDFRARMNQFTAQVGIIASLGARDRSDSEGAFALKRLDAFDAYDRTTLVPVTGRTGWLGHVALKNGQGVRVLWWVVKGPALWVLRAVELIAMIGAAAFIAVSGRTKPVRERGRHDVDPVPTG